jgi:predicted GNAT family N-acyltransferase
MPAVRVRLADAPADRETCLRLRWTVFVEEQGVPPSLEQDEHDAPGAAAVHALAEVESPRGQPVPAGTGRFTWVAPGVAKIQRMAVIDDARGQGVGAFTLDAQVSARGFYERAGYRASGGFFHDAGIPHVAMNREA